MAHSRRPVLPRLVFVSLVALVVIGAQVPDWLSAGAAEAVPGGLVPGLTLTLQTPDGSSVDARDARLVSLFAPAGAAVSPFLPVGPFKATWAGAVTVRIKDQYRFAALGRGSVSVTINDQKVLDLTGDFDNHACEPVTLHKGKTRVTVVYTPPATGDGSVRLLWAAGDKKLDPVPPNVFSHDPAADVLATHRAVRDGRALLVSMRCAACHAGVTGAAPELKQDAPSLTDVGGRLNRGYVAAWVADPKAMRPTTAMPKVVTPAEAADVAAYLCPDARPASSDVDDDTAARGARLFTGLGCVSCHVAAGIDDAEPALNRVPLKFVRAEYAPGALAAFLLKPEAHYAWSRMPNFHLSGDEATALAGWLTRSCPADAVPPPAAGDPARGKEIVAAAGCLNCHASGTSPAGPDLAGRDWSGGCRKADYGFTDGQKLALKAVSAVDWKSSLARDPAPEFAARQVSALRCTACHALDGQSGAWSNLDADVAAIEKNLPGPTGANGQAAPPALTWTGEKLRPGWAADFIAGRVSYKPRTWLFARMPAFPARADGIARGLAMSHGCPATDEERPAADPVKIPVGQMLTAEDRFGCVKCHSVGGQKAVAPFEAEAPNFEHASDRLRRDYFVRWMDNPQYFMPGTKMPAFAIGDTGKTAYTDVYDGDAAAEFDAIWNYLLTGSKITPP